MGTKVIFTKTLGAASSNNIALSQSPGTSAITLNGSAVSGGVATIDTFNATTNSEPGRRVIITSGGNDSGITFAVTGTNSGGNIVTDIVTGSSGGAAQSNLDFVTVTKIVPSGAVASTVIVGTNGVGSSRWISWNWRGYSPMNIGMAVELISGSSNFTMQYTYDDPNNLSPGVLFPLAFNSGTINGASATVDGFLEIPLTATRILINSGTGPLRVRQIQAGAG